MISIVNKTQKKEKHHEKSKNKKKQIHPHRTPREDYLLNIRFV